MGGLTANQPPNRPIAQSITRFPDYPITRFMTSIVVHYKELALKGKNRPWFIRLLVRNLKGALDGLHVASVKSKMGRIELELGPGAPAGEVRDRLRRGFGIANFSYANRGPHDFAALAD